MHAFRNAAHTQGQQPPHYSLDSKRLLLFHQQLLLEILLYQQIHMGCLLLREFVSSNFFENHILSSPLAKGQSCSANIVTLYLSSSLF